ncbi:hypothetical protein VIGAN_01515800 [Vigna angularis var. angularis]|uniref:GTP-binding protein SAR1A n=1 Tax=Vigna angularis var. angularis TaxID=157739 RepID=A0A0S3R9B0_PHAAN|nr:hypothetical protein VIGAN_01515800 [Vigna angularis var. angularis]
MPERLPSFTCSKTRFLFPDVTYPSIFLIYFSLLEKVFIFPMQLQRLVQHQPTQHPTSEELSIGKIKFKAFDLGGHQVARRVWKDYYAKVDAVVYLVDAYDKERFTESKKELDALLSDESLANVPFLVLGNKIDIPYAASEEELRYHLGLTNFTTGKGKVNLTESNLRPLEVFMCSIVRKMGYGDGFQWVSQYIK